MARPRSSASYESEANIWPAVTDSILLMASIFIVLSVIALVSIAKRVDDQAGAGEEAGDRVICEMVGLSEKLLFDQGQSEFRQRSAARSELVSKLTELSDKLEPLERYARSQKDWSQGYYLVLEVSGHTDDVPDKRPYGNWGLGARRAVTVAHEIESILKDRPELHKKFDLKIREGGKQGTAEPGKMVLRVAGYSSHLPAVSYESNDLEIARGWNRRVELRLYAQPVYVVRNEVELK